jgi:hypothetical protein
MPRILGALSLMCLATAAAAAAEAPANATVPTGPRTATWTLQVSADSANITKLDGGPHPAGDVPVRVMLQGVPWKSVKFTPAQENEPDPATSQPLKDALTSVPADAPFALSFTPAGKYASRWASDQKHVVAQATSPWTVTPEPRADKVYLSVDAVVKSGSAAKLSLTGGKASHFANVGSLSASSLAPVTKTGPVRPGDEGVFAPVTLLIDTDMDPARH